jgi:hypothetical protein
MITAVHARSKTAVRTPMLRCDAGVSTQHNRCVPNKAVNAGVVNVIDTLVANRTCRPGQTSLL